MNTLKKNRITLIIAIIVMLVSIGLYMVIPQYNYESLDKTKEQFKLLYTESPVLTSSQQSNGDYDYEFTVCMVNTTDKVLEDVVLSIYLDDSDGREFVVVCEAIEVLPDIETEEIFQSDMEEKFDTIDRLTAKIGNGEEFTLLDREVVCPSNPIGIVFAFLFFIAMIAVIVIAVRINKISKKQSEIEAKAYEARANELVDLEIRQQRAITEKREKESGIENQSNTIQSPIIEQSQQSPKSIKCDYCGHLNVETSERCSVCGAILRK